MSLQRIVFHIGSAFLLLGSLEMNSVAAHAPSDNRSSSAATSPQPISVTPTLNSASDFKDLPPWPKAMLRSGGGHHASRTLFVGQMTVEIYEGSDEVVDLVDQPYDELVHVIGGECTLTPKGGQPQHFKVGDIFIVPKGFTGTWDARKKFRELISIETNAYNQAVQQFFRATNSVPAEIVTTECAAREV